MNNPFEIRLINERDAQPALDIYKYYVDNTIISFEYDAPTLEEYIQRIKTNTTKYPWLVVLHQKKIIGFAYGSTHRYRTAYQWSPESTIYLAPGFHTRGIGRVLYKTLFSLLQLQGYINVYAGVGLPNDKSTAFHRTLGFEEIGIFKKIGYKHGNWHDTHWFQFKLSEHAMEPPMPKMPGEIKNSEAFKMILKKAGDELAKIKS